MNEIIEAASSAVAVATPSTLLALAVQQGADLDKLERLMALQERWEVNEARKAFSAAFAAFKNEAVTIVRGKLVTDGPLKGKHHAELSDVVGAVSPALSRHGLSIAWKLTKDEKDWIEVTCVLRHAGGHFESVSMGGAPDTGPGRNAIQARGSVKTYLERYTGTAILGMAPQDADDDGAGGAKNATDPLEVWAGRAALAQSLDELGLVSKDGAKHFRGSGNVEAYKVFAEAVQARGAALRAAGAQ